MTSVVVPEFGEAGANLLVFEDNDNLWVGNDGGIRTSDVSASPSGTGFNWDIKNSGYVTYQFYRGDISPESGSTLVGGGAQDNANIIMPASNNGTELGGGDGAQFAIISGTSTSTYNTLTSTQNGSLNRMANGGVNENVTPYDSGNTNAQYQGFHTYFLLDADNTCLLYTSPSPRDS